MAVAIENDPPPDAADGDSLTCTAAGSLTDGAWVVAGVGRDTDKNWTFGTQTINSVNNKFRREDLHDVGLAEIAIPIAFWDENAAATTGTYDDNITSATDNVEGIFLELTGVDQSMSAFADFAEEGLSAATPTALAASYSDGDFGIYICAFNTTPSANDGFTDQRNWAPFVPLNAMVATKIFSGSGTTAVRGNTGTTTGQHGVYIITAAAAAAIVMPRRPKIITNVSGFRGATR